MVSLLYFCHARHYQGQGLPPLIIGLIVGFRCQCIANRTFVVEPVYVGQAAVIAGLNTLQPLQVTVNLLML